MLIYNDDCVYKMRIQYFSDLHLEFFKKPFNLFFEKMKFKPSAPILILAGDIGNPFHDHFPMFFDYVSPMFEKIFYIPGNHEYYNNDMEETHKKIKTIFNFYSNVIFLQNSYHDYQGFRFVGTTLWTEIDKNQNNLINDFKMIRGMTIDRYNDLHVLSKHFIQCMLDTTPIPIIMITHHVPSVLFTDPFYLRYYRHVQPFFSNSKMNHLIVSPIHSWFYGHTHKPYFDSFQNVNICCNPIGYPGESQKIDLQKCIDIK